MKIALVNLTKLNDYAKRKSYQNDMQFLTENHIDYVDYCSGREDFDTLLEGFHEAIKNPEIDLVWFVQGGTTLIKYLRDIDWELVARTKKKYLGLSDFTHFSFKAVTVGCECYYGAGLADITKYFPTADQKSHITNFLLDGTIEAYEAKHVTSEKEVNVASENIIGGHLIISTYMLSQENIDLSKAFLFLEHHNIPGEDFIDLEYYVDQLKYVIGTNQPKGFILGHSMLFEENGEMMDYQKINIFLSDRLSVYNKPIYQIDHFKKIVKFSI